MWFDYAHKLPQEATSVEFPRHPGIHAKCVWGFYQKKVSLSIRNITLPLIISPWLQLSCLFFKEEGHFTAPLSPQACYGFTIKTLIRERKGSARPSACWPNLKLQFNEVIVQNRNSNKYADCVPPKPGLMLKSWSSIRSSCSDFVSGDLVMSGLRFRIGLLGREKHSYEPVTVHGRDIDPLHSSPKMRTSSCSCSH